MAAMTPAHEGLCEQDAGVKHSAHMGLFERKLSFKHYLDKENG